MPTNPSTKFHYLEEQITLLRAQQQTLLQERAQEMTRLLIDLNLGYLDNTILIGMFLFAGEKKASSDPLLETWRQMGKRFRHSVRKAKRTTKPCSAQKATTPHTRSQSSHTSMQSGANENA